MAEVAEKTERVRVLNRRSSSIALLLGLVIFSPFLLFQMINSVSSIFGCHVDSGISSGCIIGDREYSMLMYKLMPYVNLSTKVYQYWLSFTLIWMAIALYEARQVNTATAIVIGGASTIYSILYEVLWNVRILDAGDTSPIDLLQVPLHWALPLGVPVALAIFAVRNGFEAPQRNSRGAAP